MSPSTRPISALKRFAARWFGRARQLRRDERGVAAIEFGMIGVPFFAIIFAIVQTTLVFLADQLLETAVNDASRQIRTGQAYSNGTNQAAFKTNVCGKLMLQYLIDCNSLYINVTTVSNFSSISLTPPTIDPKTGKLPTTTTYNIGGSSDIVVVSVYYLFPTLFSNFGLSMADQSNGTRLLGAVAAFRNEPF
ncbi:MAG: pilus assembly protein [Ancalomicrobiaceae bacterium]|nr:pilus assembly protein [Ancalomicrobiaceae bacterium]